MTPGLDYAAREKRLRVRAARLGLALRRSRQRTHAGNLGGYRLVDGAGRTVAGQRFELTMDAVDRALTEREAMQP